MSVVEMRMLSGRVTRIGKRELELKTSVEWEGRDQLEMTEEVWLHIMQTSRCNFNYWQW